jgi:hypothetical protein
MSELGTYQMVAERIKAMGGSGPANAKTADVMVLGGAIIL